MPFTATGVIDRVDLVPFDEQGEKWHDDEGSNQVAPLRLFGSGWKPRRMVIIRDLKSREDFEKPRTGTRRHCSANYNWHSILEHGNYPIPAIL